jgi:hypothetical protein
MLGLDRYLAKSARLSACSTAFLPAPDGLELGDLGHEFLPKEWELCAIKRASHSLAQRGDPVFDKIWVVHLALLCIKTGTKSGADAIKSRNELCAGGRRERYRFAA